MRTNAERIRSSIKKLDRFRKWFRKLPVKAINLDNYLSDRNGDDIAICNADYHCGTVGCVLGWLRSWEFQHKEKWSSLGQEYLTNEDARNSDLFDIRLTKKPQRVEALDRLRRHRKLLVSYLKEEKTS